MSKTRENQRHKFDTRDDFLKELNKSKCLRDNKLILKFINIPISYLDTHNITKYEDFVNLFKNTNFNRKNIIGVILEFKKYIKQKQEENEFLEYDVEWICKRQLEKVHLSGKNIVFNRLFHEFSDTFLNFLMSYFQNLSGLNLDYLLFNLKSKIQSILIQSGVASSKLEITNQDQNNTVEKINFPQEENLEKDIEYELCSLNSLLNEEDPNDDYFDEFSDYSVQFEI